MIKDIIEVECLDYVVEIEISNDIKDVFDIIEKAQKKFKGLRHISLDMLCLQHPRGKILDNSLSIEELSTIYNRSDGVLNLIKINKTKIYSIWRPVKVYYLKDKRDLTPGLKRRKKEI
jgi:hypothetical protein